MVRLDNKSGGGSNDGERRWRRGTEITVAAEREEPAAFTEGIVLRDMAFREIHGIALG